MPPREKKAAGSQGIMEAAQLSGQGGGVGVSPGLYAPSPAPRQPPAHAGCGKSRSRAYGGEGPAVVTAPSVPACGQGLKYSGLRQRHSLPGTGPWVGRTCDDRAAANPGGKSCHHHLVRQRVDLSKATRASSARPTSAHFRREVPAGLGALRALLCECCCPALIPCLGPWLCRPWRSPGL